MFWREHKRFLIIFSGVIAFFLWDLIVMRSSFLGGDYLAQFYPWSELYSQAVKNMTLPFWAGSFNSGFPLMAEGQIGGYYLPNVMLFYLLPLNVAYNYSIILHFFFGGLFIYLYSRRLGACYLGGTIAALIFCFGSAYAGCFYNTVTVRTLIWMPLVLLLVEKYFDDRKMFYALSAGLVMGMQFLAGFIQLAAYSSFLTILYFLYGSISKGKRLKSDLMAVSVMTGTAVIIFLPQLLITYELVSVSSRKAADIGFALWGSYNPMGLVGLFFPQCVKFFTSDVYISVSGILLVLVALFSLKRKSPLKPLVFIGLLSFLMALGKYNPAYVALLKTIGFYGFRNPSKFIFFTMLALSALAGVGFTEFFKGTSRAREKGIKYFTITAAASAVCFLAGHFMLRIFKKEIMDIGRWYAEKFIYGRSYHVYSLDTYYSKVKSVLDLALESTSFGNAANIVSWSLLLFVPFFVYFISKNKNAFRPVLRISLAVLVFVDLYLYSFIGTGFRGNIRDFDILAPDSVKILNRIRGDTGVFRIMPYNIATGDLPFWAMPNTNSLYGLDSIAGYSPLSVKNYSDSLGPLQVVDNSLGLLPPGKDALKNNLDLLRTLNVKYIVSGQRLDGTFLEEVLEEKGVYLYLLKGFRKRAFFVNDKGPDKVEVVSYGPGEAVLKADSVSGNILVFSQMYYPGWKVYVNGVRKEIKPYGPVQSVKLGPGADQNIRFSY